MAHNAPIYGIPPPQKSVTALYRCRSDRRPVVGLYTGSLMLRQTARSRPDSFSLSVISDSNLRAPSRVELKSIFICRYIYIRSFGRTIADNQTVVIDHVGRYVLIKVPK